MSSREEAPALAPPIPSKRRPGERPSKTTFISAAWLKADAAAAISAQQTTRRARVANVFSNVFLPPQMFNLFQASPLGFRNRAEDDPEGDGAHQPVDQKRARGRKRLRQRQEGHGQQRASRP